MAEKAYYIVNPSGAVHIVTREHAKGRLRQPGWRMATDKEIKAYKDAGGLQTTKNRAADPWSPEPEPEPELPDEKEKSSSKSSK